MYYRDLQLYRKGEFILTKKLVFFYLTVLAISCFLGTANAGMQVNPFIVEVIVPEDEGYEETFYVSNDGENPLDVTIEPERWSISSLDFHEWLEIDPMQFTLNRKDARKVKYKITIPKEAKGELMCMVFFISQERGIMASPVGVKYGVPVYAIVKGTGNIDVSIENIDVNYDKENQVVTGKFVIDNRSNVHIRPLIRVTIFNEEGKITAGFELPYKQPAQREQKRPYDFSQKMFIRSGKYKVVVKADCGKLYSIDKIVEAEADLIIKEDIIESTEKDTSVKESAEQETLPRGESAGETEVQK